MTFDAREVGAGTFQALVGLEVSEAGEGRAVGRLQLRSEHLAPNGYLHAGAVVTLADTVCGFGCVASLSGGAVGFRTVELKTNFLGTACEGLLDCVSTLVHGGRTTQVWDATVADAADRTLALFCCTQLLLR